MRNTIISIVIFFALLGFVSYADNSLQDLCYNVSLASEEIEYLISEEHWDTAYVRTVDLVNEIKEKNTIASIYLNHSDFEILVNESVKLSIYVRLHDPVESTISVHLLRNYANSSFRLNKTNIENIL